MSKKTIAKNKREKLPDHAESVANGNGHGLSEKSDMAELFDVTPRTIEAWVKAGKIPAIRLSPRCVRFDKEAVLKHVRENFSTVAA